MKSVFYGLIGRHLSHSYSSLIHNELGCKDYRHLELEPNELETFIKSTAIGGMNVTIPYKIDVLPYCKVLGEEAKEIGCVNTVFTNSNGELEGHNTDADGFLFMAENAKIELKNKKAIILGSGGAHLAVKYALKKAGAKEIVTISRSGENNYSNLYKHYDADIIVNATPVGMYPECEGKIIDISPFKNCSGVLDLIYNPFRTNLLVQAEELGIPFSNGLSMLVAQALFAEEYFRGEKIGQDNIKRVMNIIARGTRNIVLIGMPGCGKSTAGKLLSKLSGKELIDTDDEIVKSAGMSIPEIFEKGGETLFRKLEREAIKKASAGVNRIIVTGGGAVKTEENYLPLKRCGKIYHLERDVSALSREGRPLSKGTDLNIMYKERLPLYERFKDVKIDVQETPEKTSEMIWSDFCENPCD